MPIFSRRHHHHSNEYYDKRQHSSDEHSLSLLANDSARRRHKGGHAQQKSIHVVNTSVSNGGGTAGMIILDRERSQDTYITQATTFTDFSSITEECRDDVEEDDRSRISGGVIMARTPNRARVTSSTTTGTRQKQQLQQYEQQQQTRPRQSRCKAAYTKTLMERDDARSFWSGGGSNRKSKSKSKKSSSSSSSSSRSATHHRHRHQHSSTATNTATNTKTRGRGIGTVMDDDTKQQKQKQKEKQKQLPPMEQVYLETTPTRTTSTLTKSLFDDDDEDSCSSEDEYNVDVNVNVDAEYNNNNNNNKAKYEMKVRRFEDDEESTASPTMMIHTAPTMMHTHDDDDGNNDDDANAKANANAKAGDKNICNTRENAAAATQTVVWSLHPTGAVQPKTMSTGRGNNKAGTRTHSTPSPFKAAAAAGDGMAAMCDIQSPMAIFSSMRAKVMSCVSPNLSSYDTPPTSNGTEQFHSFRDVQNFGGGVGGEEDDLDEMASMKYTSFSGVRRSSSGGTKNIMGSLQEKIKNNRMMKGSMEMEILSRNSTSDEHTSQGGDRKYRDTSLLDTGSGSVGSTGSLSSVSYLQYEQDY